MIYFSLQAKYFSSVSLLAKIKSIPLILQVSITVNFLMKCLVELLLIDKINYNKSYKSIVTPFHWKVYYWFSRICWSHDINFKYHYLIELWVDLILWSNVIVTQLVHLYFLFPRAISHCLQLKLSVSFHFLINMTGYLGFKKV